jgi:hypothetical protein
LNTCTTTLNPPPRGPRRPPLNSTLPSNPPPPKFPF